MGHTGRSKILLRVVASLIYAFLLLPILIVVVSALNSGGYLKFPPDGFSLRWFGSFFSNQPLVGSFIFSLGLAGSATAISTVLGAAGAMYLVRYAPPRVVGALGLIAVSPMVLPVIVTGLALLTFLYAIGLGTGSFLGLLIGHVVICVPYVFMNVSSSLIGFNRSLEEVAHSLGARSFRTFWHITLPLIKGGVIAGALFSFIISFDQFPLSLMLGGGTTSTFPVQVFNYLSFAFDPTIAAASTVSLVITILAVILVDRLVGLKSIYS